MGLSAPTGLWISSFVFLGVCSSAVKLVKKKDSSSPDGGQDGWKGMEGWKFNKRASKSQFSFLIMCYYREEEVLGKGVRECCVFLHLRGNRLLVEGKIEDRRKEKINPRSSQCTSRLRSTVCPMNKRQRVSLAKAARRLLVPVPVISTRLVNDALWISHNY